MQDASRKGRIRGGFTMGSTAGERHHKAKLTEEQVRTIRCLHAEGVAVAPLAKEFGVTWTNVKMIVTRQTWRHL